MFKFRSLSQWLFFLGVILSYSRLLYGEPAELGSRPEFNFDGIYRIESDEASIRVHGYVRRVQVLESSSSAAEDSGAPFEDTKVTIPIKHREICMPLLQSALFRGGRFTYLPAFDSRFRSKPAQCRLDVSGLSSGSGSVGSGGSAPVQ